jgi:hypothetical protein
MPAKEEAVQDIESLAEAYPVERILLRHAEVSGGLERLLALQSLSIQGKLLFAEKVEDVRLFKRSPNLMRLEITSNPKNNSDPQTRILAFDGTHLWMKVGNSQPVRLTDTAGVELFLRDVPIQTNLLLAQRDRYPVSVEAPTEFRGRLVFPLNLELPDGRRLRSLVDATTFLELSNTAYPPPGSDDLPQTIHQKAFRTVDGFTIPGVVHTFEEGQWKYSFYPEEIRFNPGILESFFHISRE